MAGSVNPDRRQKATQGGVQVGGKVRRNPFRQHTATSAVVAEEQG